MNIEPTQLKAITEAALFAADGPLTPEHIVNLFVEDEPPTTKEIRQALTELQDEYADRAITLTKVGSGYRFQTSAEYAPWISRLWDEKPPRYSRALLETLAITAYRQPVTRGEIEDIRGVAVSTSIIKTLLEREWIKVLGQRDVPGKPSIYGTTKQFLDYFSLQSLTELPPLSELKDIDALAEQFDQQLNLQIEAARTEESEIALEQGEPLSEESELQSDAVAQPADEAPTQLETIAAQVDADELQDAQVEVESEPTAAVEEASEVHVVIESEVVAEKTAVEAELQDVPLDTNETATLEAELESTSDAEQTQSTLNAAAIESDVTEADEAELEAALEE